MRGGEAAHRIVIVLEEVPHRDEVEAAGREVGVIEEAAVELDVLQRVGRREVLEVDAGRADPERRPQVIEECADRAADVQHLGFRRQREYG